MKPFRFANIFASAVVLSMASAQAGTPTPTPPPAPEPAANWATFTVGGAFISGDESNYRARTRENDIYGGISDFHYGTALDDTTSLTIDGHAMFGNEDHLLNLLLNKDDVGYLKLGYKQFRTWYDASGGYLSSAPNTYAIPFDDERYIDRGEIFLEAGLRLENLPEITFRYTHAYRDGDKDSTCWGDSLNTTGTRYKTTPSLWNIDETVDIFELDVAHTIHLTDIDVGLVYEHSTLENTRYTPRGGTTPAGANPPSVIKTSLTEEDESDLFAGHVATVTRFNDCAWLSWAASYSTLDTDIEGGSRAWGTYWPTPIGASPQRRDYAYDTMTGGSNVDQFITNLNLMWVALPDLTVTPSLRYENETVYSTSRFRAFNSNQSWQGYQSLSSDTEMDALNAALDVRYKGLDNVVLYGTADWGWEDETILRTDQILPGEWLYSDVTVDEQVYKLGANWYPVNGLSFGVQGFYGLREQGFDHTAGNQPKLTNAANGGANNFRPIMDEHNTETENINLRMTWRPCSNVSLVTRYDYSTTTFENMGVVLNAPAAAVPMDLIESGEVESHIVSETVTWYPTARMTLQGSVSWVSSETTTPMALTTPNMSNDYIVCGVSMGYALNDCTDITAGYNYFTQGNYSIAPASMGYGLETSEHVFSVGLSRMLTENMLWNINYAFITSNTDETDQSGGFNDFDAHMVSTGLQIRF